MDYEKARRARALAIYKKMGKRKESSEVLHQAAVLKIKAKDFQGAKKLLDDAVKQNPENTAAVKERDRIKLELTYQSLTPVQTPTPAPAVKAEEITSPGVPIRTKMQLS